MAQLSLDGEDLREEDDVQQETPAPSMGQSMLDQHTGEISTDLRRGDRENLSSVCTEDGEVLLPTYQKAYVFLHSRSVETLRSFARYFDAGTVNVRAILVNKCFLSLLRTIRKSGCEVDAALRVRLEWDFDQFDREWTVFHNSKNVPNFSYISKAAACKKKSDLPDHECLRWKFSVTRRVKTMLGKRANEPNANEQKGSSTSKAKKAAPRLPEKDRTSVSDDSDSARLSKEKNTKQPSFSVSEFARMLLMMKDYPQVRSAFFISLGGVPRVQMDSGVRSSHFWTTVLAPKFNDEREEPKMDLSEVSGDVDPALSPPVTRKGEYLQGQYSFWRKKFSEAWAGYQSSGQNNPVWKNFLIRGGIDTKQTLGRVLHASGIILGVGTDNLDEDFLGAASRVIGGSMSGPGYDGGSKEHEFSELQKRPRSRRTSSDSRFHAEAQQMLKSFLERQAANQCGELPSQISGAPSVGFAPPGIATRGANADPSRDNHSGVMAVLDRTKLIKDLGELIELSANTKNDEMRARYNDQADAIRLKLDSNKSVKPSSDS